MRSPTLAWLAALALAVAPLPAAAEADAPPAADPTPADAAAADPAPADAAATDEATADAAATDEADPTADAGSSAPAPGLGPIGVDEQGRTGRLHVVREGDTLWDISDAYLGTPWVWPSIWQDNGSIADPDRLAIGDRLWITPHEMRAVSEAEAEALLAGGASEEASVPAAQGFDGLAIEDDVDDRRTYTFAEIETSGFIAAEELAGAATLVDSPIDRKWLAEQDVVVLGLGAGAVRVGDEFEVFRTGERIFDGDHGLVGYETEELGWVRVTDVHAESATAVIRLSRSEMKRGDHVMPRRRRSAEIELGDPPDVEGRILFTPSKRLEMASHDVVYLDRGRHDGLEIGSPLEIYRPLGTGVDEVTGPVTLPDEVVATLVVVAARERSAVAVVAEATAEVGRGDRFRGAGR